jgi:hypothetical protein
MNSFQRHHQHAIQFSYACFDRIILNGYILPFQHTECGGTIHWFLRTYRQAPRMSRAYFAQIAADYHGWVDRFAEQAGIAIVEPPKGARREDLVAPYFQTLGSRPGVAVILKAREPERIAWYFAKINQVAVQRRFVNLYYFYLNDAHCGHMFLRICPYFPFTDRCAKILTSSRVKLGYDGNNPDTP